MKVFDSFLLLKFDILKIEIFKNEKNLKHFPAKKWQSARAIKNYINTMSSGDFKMELSDVIKLFTFDQANIDEIEKSVCDPNDREKGLETLRLVKRFDRFLDEGINEF